MPNQITQALEALHFILDEFVPGKGRKTYRSPTQVLDFVRLKVTEAIAALHSTGKPQAIPSPAVGAEQIPAGYNRPPNGEPCNTDDWNAGYEAGLADGRGVGSAPVAWMYEHDGSLDEPILTVSRWPECHEPWNETPLDALTLAKHAIQKVWLDAVGAGNGEHSISEAARVRVEFAADALKLGLRLPSALRNTGVESPTKENS